jgi:hypothetical protein
MMSRAVAMFNKTTLAVCELHMSEKSISLAFKQAPYEVPNLYRTKLDNFIVEAEC